MSAPLFPKLIPSAYDKLWFNVDKPCDDENELLEQEEEYQTMVFYLFLSLWILLTVRPIHDSPHDDSSPQF